MEITEVRVKLVSDSSERLQAFCSITFDNAFVVRDLKIIEGVRGPFVAMPSRKLADHCPQCNAKNHLRARHCNNCGGTLNENRASKDAEGRARLHADIAHPINSTCREQIQQRVLEAYREELGRSREPGYEPVADEELLEEGDSYDSLIGSLEGGSRGPSRPREPGGRRGREGERRGQGRSQDRRGGQRPEPGAGRGRPSQQPDRPAPRPRREEERTPPSPRTPPPPPSGPPPVAGPPPAEPAPPPTPEPSDTEGPAVAPPAPAAPVAPPSDESPRSDEPRTAPDEDEQKEDDQPFGAGILD